MTVDDFGVGGLACGICSVERKRCRRGGRAAWGGVRWWRVRVSAACGSCARWARARVDGVGESRVAFKPLVPLRGRPAGDVVGANEGEVGARRRGALVGSSPKCVLAGSVQRTGGLKATLHSSCRRRGGRAAWGLVWWRRVRPSVSNSVAGRGWGVLFNNRPVWVHLHVLSMSSGKLGLNAGEQRYAGGWGSGCGPMR